MSTFVELFVSVLLLTIGFGMLVKGSELFVDASSGMAKKLGVSQLVIALTVVAMGTSIPETAVSLLAAVRGNAELAVGNIVGTNTLNILLILGLTALIVPLTVQRTTVRYEIPIMITAAVIFPLLGLGGTLFFIPGTAEDGLFSRTDGLFMLLLFGLYLGYLFYLARSQAQENMLIVPEPKISWSTLILVLIIGLILIIAGSSVIVRGATNIAEQLHVPERVIGLTIVAFGTSLPELATSITAALKHQPELAVGNIVGSNIYNMLFIGGLTAVVTPVPYDISFRTDSLVCIGTSVLLLVFILLNRKRMLSRLAGTGMLLSYGVYLMYLLR